MKKKIKKYKKVHLGCANKHIQGWVNIDIHASGADIHDDAKTLTSISNGSCELIYASHLLEHFGRKEVLSVIKVWHRKLKPNGILRLSVPDFEKVIRLYQKKYTLETLLGFLVGGQKDEHDYHKMVFDKTSLTKLLRDAGFKKIRSWDWRKTEHSQYDDYSQAYLPHMEKETGTMMSLNLEAIK